MSILSALLITFTALTAFTAPIVNVNYDQAVNHTGRLPQKIMISSSASDCIIGGGSHHGQSGGQNQDGNQEQDGSQNSGQETPDSQSYAA